MRHLNSHRLCVFGIVHTVHKTVDYQYHDILDVAAIMLTDKLDIDKNILPFNLRLKPRFDRHAKTAAYKESVMRGMDYFQGAELFTTWVEQQKLPKKLAPIGYNWPINSALLHDWLGTETYNMLIDFRFRDILSMAALINDKCWANQEPYVTQKLHLNYILSALQIDKGDLNYAMNQAVAISVAFKRLIYHRIGLLE